jgi:hypothetical protein
MSSLSTVMTAASIKRKAFRDSFITASDSFITARPHFIPGPLALPSDKASCRIAQDTATAVSSAGVDLISSGWITHSAAID